MATEKLYYQDQYMRSFTSKVQKLDQDEKGRFYVVLEKTAFYPTGGGQPYDTGTLNGARVYDVEEVEGEIRHYIEEPIKSQVHNEYVGELDWNRRFDHMQQHAGQHILSAAFENVYGYKTVSFHLGKEVCTIDLNIANLTDEEASQVEAVANNIILENRSIDAKWVTQRELEHFSLRKELSVSENIRLVIIPDFDYNGCGGTHPNSTGQVSSIKILHWEKQKKHIRVYFVCGNRVLKQLHEKQKVIQSLTTILNAPQEQMKEAANRVLQQTRDLEKTVDELRMKLIDHEVNAFIDKAQLHGDFKLVKAIFLNRPIVEVQQLAKTITMKTNDILVVFINENETKLQLVCTRSNELNINMNQLVKGILPIINGKGGGNTSFAQGGGDKIVSAERLMEELMKLQV
ncbi:serine-tRNA(Ala) deacylase AlaX [Risungbinella massiliensis]|uniref:serine-tRNA(Ala) deacylase AlaX n=1 Tax=Risungbinella massiliensis TaxID=1329796 RepID=UPI0005CBBE89|nr:serine-tRNA(Ala) deacylase AlaX [Risungbinella massiliensis]